MKGNQIHPAIAGILYELPRAGEKWSPAQKERFMALLTLILDFVYPPEEDASSPQQRAGDGG